jgi:hypothetical protein
MNIYFLVEGRSTEKKIYPKWLAYLIPELTQVKYYDEVQENNYYLISGKGYPAILSEGLPNAADKLRETQRYDYLVLCVDADEETVEERTEYIKSFIQKEDIELGKTKLVIIVQNRCIETWLLGNRKIFDSRQPQDSPLSDYVKYYDVSQEDPELMGAYQHKNHADFHQRYLKAIFRAKNIVYTKDKPRDAQKEYYLKELINRIRDRPDQLKTFQALVEFCDMIKDMAA